MKGVRVIALSGGVGGAKLADGLYRHLGPDTLGVLVNTGDDFVHLGLTISPDVDTVLYTLAGLADPMRGWGRADESWDFMAALRALDGPGWFNLGDRDLALHVWRSAALAEGRTPSAVTADLAVRLGIAAAIWPMSDAPVATTIASDEGMLAFQDYFVARQCRPVVHGIDFVGRDVAAPSADLLGALADAALEAIVLCPSNPWLSIDPVLAVPGLRAALRGAGVPIVAVSPLVAGRAVKGPTAKIMEELGIPVSSTAIALHYAGLIDGLVIDIADDASAITVPVHRTHTLMKTPGDRLRLARETLAFAASLGNTA